MSYVALRHAGADDAPVVFTFHGTGGNETQFHDLARRLLPEARVVSPRGDVSEGGALRYFRRTGEGIYDMDDLARRTVAMGEFVASEKAAAPEALALGYSNGANIIASVSFSDPDAFDRMILLHPLVPFDPPPQPGLRGRRVLITAGERDPICPPDHTRALERYYREQGADVTVAWHGGGHEIQPVELEAIRAFLARTPA